MIPPIEKLMQIKKFAQEIQEQSFSDVQEEGRTFDLARGIQDLASELIGREQAIGRSNRKETNYN